MSNKLQLRRDTAENWESANPVLAQGEIGLILDENGKTTGQKIGDGVTEWKKLETVVEVNNYVYDLGTLLDGYINQDGMVSNNSSYQCTDYIAIYPEGIDYTFVLSYKLKLFTNTSISIYDADKQVLHAFAGTTSNNTLHDGVIDLNDYPTAKYFRATIFDSDGQVKRIKTGTVVSNDSLKDGSISEKKLSFIVHDPESNYIDRTKLTSGKYIASDGSIKTTGASGYFITDKIPLKEGVKYYHYGLYLRYTAFYDENGSPITYEETLSNPIIPPVGTAYGRFTINAEGADQTCWLSTSPTKPDDYSFIISEHLTPGIRRNRESISKITGAAFPTEYNGRDCSAFSKILCIGDSLTQGVFNHEEIEGETFTANTEHSYPSNLRRISGCETINMGVGGITSDRWYEQFKNDEKVAGCDCCIIALGVNDNGDTLETVSRTAFINIVNLVKTKNPQIKIFLSGIINGKSYSASDNSQDYYEKDQFIRALYEELWASDNQVFFIDMVKYGHLQSLISDSSISYPIDNYNMGHLSAYGYWRLAMDFYNYISYIMANDKENLFRNIQFTGTNFYFKKQI